MKEFGASGEHIRIISKILIVTLSLYTIISMQVGFCLTNGFCNMRDILTKLDVERDLTRIEIYKSPDFDTYFERYIDEIVSAHRLFLTRHFPFAEFLVAFFHHIRRILYQFFRFQ